MTSHSITLSGLASGTLFNYRVRSADASGNEDTSANYIFTTLGTVGSPVRFIFTGQPRDAYKDSVIKPAITIQVLDSLGLPVNQSGISVMMEINSGTGFLDGTLTRLTDANGVATFDDLSINKTGKKKLVATNWTLEGDVSAEFEVLNIPRVSIVSHKGISEEVVEVSYLLNSPVSVLVVFQHSPDTLTPESSRSDPVFREAGNGQFLKDSLIFKPKGQGQFLTIILIDSNGNEYPSSDTVFVQPWAVGIIDEISEQVLIGVYPNVVVGGGSVVLEVKESTPFSIMSMNGQLVLAGALDRGRNVLFVPYYCTAGIYYINVGDTVKKLIIMK